MLYMFDPQHSEAVATLCGSSLNHILWIDPLTANWRQDASALLLHSDTRSTRDGMLSCKVSSVIVRPCVEVDTFDLNAAREPNTAVQSTPGQNSGTVAQLSKALDLALTRRDTAVDLELHNELGEKTCKMLLSVSKGKTAGVLQVRHISRLVIIILIDAGNTHLARL